MGLELFIGANDVSDLVSIQTMTWCLSYYPYSHTVLPKTSSDGWDHPQRFGSSHIDIPDGP